MTHICCASCSLVLTVEGHRGAEELESLIGTRCEWYPDKYPCPRCGAKMDLTRVARAGDVVYLTALEAFAAFSGAGLPSEQECSASRVKHLLTTTPVTGVGTRHIPNTSRCLIDYIELEGGLVIHLSASALGACAHRISAPSGFVEAAK